MRILSKKIFFIRNYTLCTLFFENKHFKAYGPIPKKGSI